MSHWVDLPSAGCFVHLARGLAETPELARALIQSLLDGLALDPDEVKLVAFDHRRWRGFAWRAVDEALGDPDSRWITLMVGVPSKVHLGARIPLRSPWQDPPVLWLCAESQRWTVDQLEAVGRRWFELVAAQAEPIGGGIGVAANLLECKNEMSLEFEDTSSPCSVAHQLFMDRVHRDRAWMMWNRIRRIYPVTLLGPAFASDANAALLRAGGARVESVAGSRIVDGHAPLIPVWDPAYLTASVELRRVAWPLTIQNLADAEGLRHREHYTIPDRTVPEWEPPLDKVRKECDRQRREVHLLVKRAARPIVEGVLVREGPELAPPPREPLPEPKPSKKRVITKLGDLF